MSLRWSETFLFGVDSTNMLLLSEQNPVADSCRNRIFLLYTISLFLCYRLSFFPHLLHYEAYSAEMFGRDIPQTMVLTPSRLITDTADEFFTLVSKRGYSFVPLDEAQGDAAYKTKEEFVGDAGISWFERWQMAKGRPLLKEPQVDSAVQKMWEERKAVVKK